MIRATVTMLIEGDKYADLAEAMDALVNVMKTETPDSEIPYDGLLKIVNDNTQAISTAHIVASHFKQYLL